MFVLKMDTDNLAFTDFKTGEIASILTSLALRVRCQADDENAYGDLFDVNGTRVGHWEFMP